MKVKDYYEAAKADNHHSLELLIEFLVYEKKVLQLTDDQEKLTYYMQERFRKKMNEHLLQYKKEREHGQKTITR